MFRAAALLAFACAAGVVAAAPVPPPSEKERIATLWGKTEGGGKFELNGRQLVLRADGDATHPRVTRTVRGDFVAETAVAEAACPDATKGDSAAELRSCAGLFVAGGDYRLRVCLFQSHTRGDGKRAQPPPRRCVWVEQRYPSGASGTGLEELSAPQSVRVRITRVGKSLTVAHRLDGKEWTESTSETDKLDLPDEVAVGVFLAHTSRQALHAAFDALTVEKPKK